MTGVSGSILSGFLGQKHSGVDIGGVLFAFYLGYISPNNFTLDASILVLTMAIIGGRDSILGAIIGSAVLIALPEALRGLSDYRMLIYGVGLVCMIIFKPEGIAGKYGKN